MPQSFSSTQVAELICTRISHDLIGNIGAVSNAVELLDDDPESIEDVKPILEISSKVLSDRLKFFRLAFGLNNATLKNVEELSKIAQNYVQTLGNRNFPINLDIKINNVQIYKIVLLGIMSLTDVFIKGGKLCVTENSEGLDFIASSDFSLSKPKLQNLQNVLQGILPDENPAQYAQTVYLQSMLHNLGITVKASFSEFEAKLQIA
ncbi:MAG: hypothetical protein IJF12_03160 [Alphaproteobacteria bacterium]|nr:hypothetical protein [Alphaproteobacteria bacterium]MBQ2811149.1 hypothetical protein [Alphaproteobacteria bacterium]